MSTLSKTRSNTVFRRHRISLLSLLGLMRQRRALKKMGDAQLHDLGITREDATAEARRPVWDVPSNWMQ